MRLLVTGGTGYLGEAVVRHLVEAGHETTVLCRETSDTSGLPPGVETRTGDVTAPASLEAAAADCEVLVHGAGLVRSWHPDPELYHRVNVEGARNAVRAARAAGCRRVVLTASIIALGPTGDKVCGTDHLVRRRRFGNLYEETKYRGLLASEEEARQQGIELVSLCPAIVYGPGRRTRGNLVSQMVADFLAGGPVPQLAGGRPVWCYSYVEDVAEGHRQAVERGRPGARYVLGGENASLREFFDLVEEISGVRARRLPVPVALAKILGGGELLLAKLFGRDPTLTPGTVDILASNWAFHSREAEEDLGYRPLSLRDGLVRTIAWLRETA